MELLTCPSPKEDTEEMSTMAMDSEVIIRIARVDFTA